MPHREPKGFTFRLPFTPSPNSEEVGTGSAWWNGMPNSDGVYIELVKSFFTLLLLCLCPWLALSAWSQTPQPPRPLSQVQQYLGLTDVQVKAILQNNSD